MLRSRVIPSLLIDGERLVKTVKFDSPKYVGDPLNTVRIFNEKEVDELAIFDIRASIERREPDYDLIKRLAAECRMPLCYGGGVKTVEQADRIVGTGVEKVSISSSAVGDPDLVTEMAQKVGSQSVAVVLDTKWSDSHKRYEVWTHNASRPTERDVVQVATDAESAGAGEIIVNSIDRDGTMQGYDLGLAQLVRSAVGCPLTVLGGAGSLEDLAAVVKTIGTVGAGAGSLFVFKGPYRAVLISYPDRAFRKSISGDPQE